LRGLPPGRLLGSDEYGIGVRIQPADKILMFASQQPRQEKIIGISSFFESNGVLPANSPVKR
jgi:hypothetical protein